MPTRWTELSAVALAPLLSLALLLVACGPAAGEPAQPPSPTTSSTTAVDAGSTPVDLTSLPLLDDALFPSGPCGGFESRSLVRAAAPLLSGRLTIRAVEGLASNARPYNVMSAPEADESETRLYLEVGQSQLVVFVEELFSRPGAHAVADIAAEDRYAKDATIGRLAIEGLPTIAVVPKEMVPDHEKAVALRLYVVTPDDLLVRFTFAVTPDVLGASAGCTRLARSMADTLAFGGRKVDLAGGERKLEGGVTMTLPADVAMVAQPGPDFVVYHAYVVSTLDAADGAFHVYFGDYPEQPRGQKKIEGKLLGESVTWLEDTSESGTRGRQALVQVPGDRGLFMHVFYGAKSPAVLAAFDGMAASLTKR